MKIANHEVTSITKETAQVGCTKVTLAEAEALVEAMKTAEPDFEFVSAGTSLDYVKFMLYTKYTGFVATARKERVAYDDMYAHTKNGFDNHSVAFCLRKEQAKDLYEFLKKELGY